MGQKIVAVSSDNDSMRLKAQAQNDDRPEVPLGSLSRATAFDTHMLTRASDIFKAAVAYLPKSVGGLGLT